MTTLRSAAHKLTASGSKTVKEELIRIGFDSIAPERHPTPPLAQRQAAGAVWEVIT